MREGQVAHLQLDGRASIAEVDILSQEGPIVHIALGRPAPLQRPENQRHHIPGYEHVHAVVLARGHYQDAQHRHCQPHNHLRATCHSRLSINSGS